MTKILGIDVGGSAFKGAPVETKTGRMLADRHRVEVEAPCPIPHGLAAVGEIVRHFKWKGPVGIGFPGTVRDGRIGYTGNLGANWDGKDGPKIFCRATGRPVRLLNDADAAGLAEMRFGAGKGEPGVVLMLTLGTGIGTALFYRGRLTPKVELCYIPWRGKPIECFAAAAVRKRRKLSWSRWAARVNIFLGIAERLCEPDLIIIGGGVSKHPEKWLRFIKARARVRPATLHNDAGIVGAALAWEHLKQSNP